MSPNIKHITVLMPTFNCAEYIKQSINSILNQTFREFEFLIIDDCSDDNTEEIVRSFKDSRINYIKRPENKGTSAALNYGLNKASGDWIARIDSDDINTTDRLQTQINFHEDNPNFDVISSWSIYFDSKERISFFLKGPVENSDIYEFMNLHNPLNQSGIFYRKKTILKAGYSENFSSNEDFELFHRIRDQVRFHIIPKFLVYTRLRHNSKTYSRTSKNIYDFLFPEAFKNLMGSQSKGSSFYWAEKIAWINFFYGRKNDARRYFANSFSLKNILAYSSTFLPEKLFKKLIDSRIRFRLRDLLKNKSFFKKELKRLLESK